MSESSLFLLEMFTKFGAKSKDKQIYHPAVEGGKKSPLWKFKFCNGKHKRIKETILILFLAMVVDIY